MSRKNFTTIRVGRHVVGEVKDGVFCKRIRGSIHLLRTPRAIAFDLGSLDQAQKAGAVRVEVVDTETNTSWRASLEHIRSHGFEFDRGYGKQIALVMDGWICQRKGDFVQLTFAGGVGG